MLKYWRVWILIICVLASVLAIGLKMYPYGRNGVEVSYVSDQSPAYKLITQGMVITHLNGDPIKNMNEWLDIAPGLSGPVTIKANGEEYNLHINTTLGIDVLDIERTNLDFGLDLRGGTRILLKPKENVTKDLIRQAKSTLQTRANLLGLKEIKFKLLTDISGENFIQIEASGVSGDVVNNILTKVGKFEARVTKPVDMIDNKGNLVLGENKYLVELENETLLVNKERLEINQTFELEDITFEYRAKRDNTVMLLADVYQGRDIELVYSDSQHSGVVPAGDGYRFFFTVLVSKKGSEKFAKVTTGIPAFVDLQSGDEYLKDCEIFLYLDGDLITNLRISSELGGKVYTTPQITGYRSTSEDAAEEKMKLQTILRSGAVPTGLEVVSADIISPTLGQGFIKSAAIVALLAAGVVFVIVFVRYRKLKVSLPLVFIALSEVVLILGIASINDKAIWAGVLVINVIVLGVSWWKKHEVDLFAWVGALSIPLLGMAMSWTIDLPAIGGIIAAIGTGVDHQIIIADETVAARVKKLFSMKDKIKVAFFIIFGAAATTIFAMMPLIFLVAEFVRGFAMTTIIGVWVGISITRPAYARIIEAGAGD